MSLTTPLIGLLKFSPRLVEKVWGGRRLASAFGRELPEGSPMGESWEISGLRESLTFVAEGPLVGADLYRLATTHGKVVFGADLAEECLKDFPLLVKFIDASDVLSVQVHPNDEFARADGFAYGKSEAWVIVDAEPGSCLYRGFAPGVGPDDFRGAIDSGEVKEVEKCLQRVEVKAGDVVDLPAGVVHAIGAGILLCEIQQSCDLTYRVYDWGRVGLDGKPRELHLDKAFEVMSFDRIGSDTVEAETSDCDGCTRGIYRDGYPFHLETASAEGTVELDTPPDRFEVICALAGSAVIKSPSGETSTLTAGNSAMVPASWRNYVVETTDQFKWVRSWVVS